MFEKRTRIESSIFSLESPSLKLLGKAFLTYQLQRYGRAAWPLTYWSEYQFGLSTNQGLSTYQVWSFWDKVFSSFQLHNVWRPKWYLTLHFDLLTLTIDKDHQLIKVYIYLLSLKLLGQSILELWVAQKLRKTDIPTFRLTDMCKAICPSFFERGGGGINILSPFRILLRSIIKY